jgi:hypothetical protein
MGRKYGTFPQVVHSRLADRSLRDFGLGSTYFTLEITSRTRESWTVANSELSAAGRSDRTRLFETTGKTKTMTIPSAKANETMNTCHDLRPGRTRNLIDPLKANGDYGLD